MSHHRDAARHQLACDPGSQSAKTRRGLAFGERGGPHPHAESRLAAFFLHSSAFARPRSRTASWCLAASPHVTKSGRTEFSQKHAERGKGTLTEAVGADAGTDVLRSGPSEACRASVRWANAPQAGDTGLGLGAPDPRLRDTGSGGAFARRADRHASRTSVPAYARAAATSYRMRSGFSRQSDEMTK